MGGLIFAAVTLGLLLVVALIVTISCIVTQEWGGVIMGILHTIIITAFEVSIISDIQYTPTAIDVYRGLTELEITSVNGVPKDTKDSEILNDYAKYFKETMENNNIKI